MFVGTLALTGSIVAQKPASDASHYSLEGLASINTVDGFSWSAPSLRMRYFVTDNIAARLQFGLGDGTPTPSKESYTYYENVDGTGAKGSSDISRSAWNLNIGGEYHLGGTDKMSPFFSGGIGFGKGSYEENWANYDGTSYSAVVTSASIVGGYSTFGWNLGAGFDYYVAENIYVGLEMSLSGSKVTNNDGVVTVTTPAGTSNGGFVAGNTMSYTNLGAAHGNIRIGWRF